MLLGQPLIYKLDYNVDFARAVTSYHQVALLNSSKRSYSRNNYCNIGSLVNPESRR